MHQKRGWPHRRIYIYNYSHDTIISHHNSLDVNSNRDLAPHDAYQTAARLVASGPAIYTTHDLSFCAATDRQLSVSLPRCLSPCLSFVPKASQLVHVQHTQMMMMMMANLPGSHNVIWSGSLSVFFFFFGVCSLFLVCFPYKMMDDRQPHLKPFLFLS